MSSEQKFILNATNAHDGKYNYKEAVFINQKTNVSIVCSKHGVFQQTPYAHVNLKRGCTKCGTESRGKKRALTTDIFISKAKAIHLDLYDYSKVDYVNNHIYVNIVCSKHGEFYQSPTSHLAGRGCLQCGGKVKLTTEQFISNAKAVHGDKYDYSKVNYVTAKVPVKIICSKHGVFEQIPGNHTNGSGCYSCMWRIIVDTAEYVERAKAVHGDKYDYSKVNYVNGLTLVTVGCKVHGYFEQGASEHTRGRGCRKCSSEYTAKLKTLTTQQFVAKATAIHGGRYDYSEVDYVNCYTPVNIICSQHGVFKQLPPNHTKGHGCHRCSSSKGEVTIAKILKKHGIEFTQEYAIPNYNSRFRYDFHLSSSHLLIEFHGAQHYRPIQYFGGEAGFLATKVRDDMKKTLAKAYGYKLLEVSYSQLLNLSEEDFELKLLRNIEMLKPLPRKGKE